MSVTSVLLPDGSKANIGQIVTLHGEVQHGRSHPMLESLATACVVCNNSVPTYGKKRALGSPTETALMQFAQKLGLEDLRKDWQRIKEVRYTFDKKINQKCMEPIMSRISVRAFSYRVIPEISRIKNLGDDNFYLLCHFLCQQ